MNINTLKITISDPIKCGEFQYSNTPGFTYANGDIYTFDFNNDGLQEVLFAAFETQYNTPENFTNSNITIFGWQGNNLCNRTSDLLYGEMNDVEGTGDVTFGDFNGDDLIDIYLSANADMNYLLNPYVLLNRGRHFEKIKLDDTQWEHGVASGDLNNDGYDDVVTVGYSQMNLYYGSPLGLVKSDLMSMNGSGVAIADFLNNHTQTVIVTDAPSENESDTKLYSIEYDNNNRPNHWQLISTLPTPRLAAQSLKQELYGSVIVQYPGSHGVRAEPLDFSGDGIIDVLIFENGSSGGFQGSQIQFLKNLGEGKFQDVTDQFLIGYPLKSQIAYNPLQLDLNNDKKIDLFIGLNKGNSAFLINNSDGEFLDKFRTEIDSALINEGIRTTIAKGPNDRKFLVQEDRHYGGKSEIYTSQVIFHNEYMDSGLSDNILCDYGDDTIYGGLGNDNIDSNEGNDQLAGGVGDDTLIGGLGNDKAIFIGNRKDYSINLLKNYQLKIESAIEGTDLVKSVECFEFNDGVYTANELIEFNGVASMKTWRGLSMRGVKLSDYGQDIVSTSGTVRLTGIYDEYEELDGTACINPSIESPKTPNDASISLTDVLATLKIYLGKSLPDSYKSPFNLVAADFNGDGAVNLTDVLSLLKFYLGKSTLAAPNWVFVNVSDVIGTGDQASIRRESSDGYLDLTHSRPQKIIHDFSLNSNIELMGVLRGDVDGSWISQ